MGSVIVVTLAITLQNFEESERSRGDGGNPMSVVRDFAPTGVSGPAPWNEVILAKLSSRWSRKYSYRFMALSWASYKPLIRRTTAFGSGAGYSIHGPPYEAPWRAASCSQSRSSFLA
jgi:hypothetical protein